MQDDNSPCKGMIQYPRWHLLSAKEQFNMRRSNSRCKMTHKSPREQFKMRRDNLNIMVTMQHSMPQFNMLVRTGYWNSWHCSCSGAGPTQSSFPVIFLLFSFSVLSAVSACHLCFLHDERGREGCFFYITGMAEQLLAPVYIGKFYSLFSQKIIRQIVLKWTHASWLILKVFTLPPKLSSAVLNLPIKYLFNGDAPFDHIYYVFPDFILRQDFWRILLWLSFIFSGELRSKLSGNYCVW